ncbi:MAG: VTT domain-containing protein [Clostridia bacterium]
MNKILTKKEKTIMLIRLFIIITVVFLFLFAAIKFFPIIKNLGNETYRVEFKETIAAKGFIGVLEVLALQILQIVVAIIPGQPMEVIAGMLYGTFGGILLCLIGIFIGTSIVYFTVRKIGIDFVQLFFSKEKIDKVKESKIFKNKDKFTLLMFIIFLIPVIPKDIFIYLGGLSTVEPKKFLTIATLARIPGLFVTVYAGNKLSEGSFFIVALLILLFIVIGIIGYYIGKSARNKLEKEVEADNKIEKNA